MIMSLGCASTFSLIGIFIIKDIWLHFLTDNVDLFHILGSCRHLSSACLVAENKKYRQLDWTIHFTLGVIHLSFLSFCKSWLCSCLSIFPFFPFARFDYAHVSISFLCFFLFCLLRVSFSVSFILFSWRSVSICHAVLFFWVRWAGGGWVSACSNYVSLRLSDIYVNKLDKLLLDP